MEKFLNFFVDDPNTKYDLGRSFATFPIHDDEIEGGESKVQSQQV
jgi:hypothetical protein